jgi:hypothetical protein
LNGSNQQHNENVADSIQSNSNQNNDNIDPYLLELTRQEEASRREAVLMEEASAHQQEMERRNVA